MATARARILYVDDDAELRLCVEGTLTRAGYDVTTAGSAAQGLTCLRDRHYDLVIADQWMPDETGTGLQNRARQVGLLTRTRSAVVTSDLLTPARRSPLRWLLAFAGGVALVVVLRERRGGSNRASSTVGC